MDFFSLKNSYDRADDLAAFGKNLPPIKRLWGSFIIDNSLTLFPSERGSGKSFLAMQIFLAVAYRMSSFCNEVIEVHGNTLYINCELSRELVARRLAKLYAHAPFNVQREHFESYVYTTRQSFANDRTYIVDKIEELKPVLVILDNWKTAYQDIDNNKNKDATKAVLDLLNLKDKYRFALVVIDHTRKGTKLQLTDSDLQSGSGAKSDLADQDFFLRKSSQNPNFRILKRSKSRLCEEARNAKLLRLNPDTLWFEVEQEVVNEADHVNGELMAGLDEEALELAKAMREKGASLREIAETTGLSKSALHRKFK